MTAENASITQKRCEICNISEEWGSSGAQGGPGFQLGRGGLASTTVGNAASSSALTPHAVSLVRRITIRRLHRLSGDTLSVSRLVSFRTRGMIFPSS